MAITKPVDLWTMLRIAQRFHRTNSNSKPPCRDEKCVHHVPERPSTLSPVQTRTAGEGDHAKHGGGGYTDPALQSALDRLVDADLLFVQGAGAQATYRFKHALIQDAAYESLLKSRRQALHRRAGEILRDKPEN